MNTLPNNNPNLKFLGPMRLYELDELNFKKKCDTKTEQQAELRGIMIAKNLGIPTIISNMENDSDWLVFPKISLLRLDQRLSEGLCLNLIERAGEMISILHSGSIVNFNPDLKMPYQRILSMFIGLYRLGDFPDSFFTTNLGKIVDRLEQYSLQNKACYIHGDYLPQNIFVDTDLLIFDWEYSCYSDPAYDLGAFMSFIIQFFAKNSMSYKDVLLCEYALLHGYSKLMAVDDNFHNRFYFYKIFDTHSMYWLYLLIISELTRTENLPDIISCAESEPKKRNELLSVLRELGFNLKPKSVFRLLDMIAKDPQAFELLPAP